MATNSSAWVIVSIHLPQVFLWLVCSPQPRSFVVSRYGLHPVGNRTPRVLSALWLVSRASLYRRSGSGSQKTPQTSMHGLQLRSSVDHISLLEDLGWLTSMMRSMRSDSERCSCLWDKKPNPRCRWHHLLAIFICDTNVTESWDSDSHTCKLSLSLNG